MIKIEKDLSKIPPLLQKENRKQSFQKNIKTTSYCDDKNRYKSNSILKELKIIYHLKCAYCEKKLLDSPKHIEHYRPKSVYYWLAYSWDNLLLCCTSCNSSKSIKFKIKNKQAKYDNQKFEDIHNLRDVYDKIEEPFLINPEKDDVFNEVRYDINAKISSYNNSRLKYTIEDSCKLNRKELQQKRLIIITDFIFSFEGYFLIFIKNRNRNRNKNIEIEIEIETEIFKPTIDLFVEKCNITEEFYSFRKFIIENIEIFFKDKIQQKILNYLLASKVMK